MKHEATNKFFLFLGDIFLLYLSLFFTLLIEYGGIPIFPSLEAFFIYSTWLFLLWLFFLWMLDFYSLKIKAGSFDFFRYLLIFVFLCLFSGVLYFYFQPDLPISPKTIFVLQIIIFCLLFLCWRVLFDFVFKKRTKKKKIIILGSPPELEDLLSHLKKPLSSYKVIGLFDEKNSKEIEKVIEKEKVRKVIVSNGLASLKGISFFSKIEVESFANFYEETVKKVALSVLEKARFLEEFYKEEEKSYIASKKVFDSVFLFAGVLILCVLCPFIAFAIKIDSQGPVFFTQKRIGKGRKVFNSYKFRSMVSSKKENVKIWREKDKNEITRVGKFLRFTHLDELPQLLNILKGDISFVGPRQEWEKLGRKFEKEIPFYFLRYKVRPGLTGWAQINLPPSVSVGQAKEKFQYDLYYIKHRSFLFDIVIFLKSLRKIFG